MKLFGIEIPRPLKPAALEQKQAGAGGPELTPVEGWLRGDSLPGGGRLTSAYEQVVWVYRAINVLAEQVANVPFRFSTGLPGGENLIQGGPLAEFYARPNPQLNRFQYWELRVMWLMLRGECFRVPIFERDAGTGRRRLAAVLLPDPARFVPVVEDHQLLGWRYTGCGTREPLCSQVFLPEEVWFEKLPNPFDFWRGLPPLALARVAAETDYAAGTFMKELMENNGEAGLIVRAEKPLTPSQEEQLRATLRQRKRGGGFPDRAIVVAACNEIVRPQLLSSDLQFLENRKFSRTEICAAFGVPEEIVATTDAAKYDVMSGARLNFIENRVAPFCRRLEAEEMVTVRSLEARAVGWFDLESLPILQEARRARLATAKAGFDMGIPFNDLNQVLDLGFRPLPWGNDGYLPAKLRRAGARD